VHINRRLSASVAVATMSVALVACGSSNKKSTGSQNGSGTHTIGVANYTLQAPYFIAMSKAIQEEASTVGNVKVKVTDANGDAAKLTTDVQSLVDQKVDGIIVSGGPLEAAPALLNAAKQAHTPVVMVDRKLKGGDYASWIGPNNLAIGKQDGQYIADQLKGTGTVAIIRGGPADNTIGLDRTNGVLSVLKTQPGIKTITAPDFGNWATDGGVTVAETLLAKNKNINAIFCENDSMCLGAQKAIKDASRSNGVFLVAADGQKEALKAILDGTNYGATGLNNSDKIGRLGLHRLLDILNGVKVEKDTVVPSPEITKDNAKQYYNANSLF
jgi:ribose transport system substrate-binding protein